MAGEKYHKNSRALSPAAMIFLVRCFMGIVCPKGSVTYTTACGFLCLIRLLRRMAETAFFAPKLYKGTARGRKRR